ncbi:RNA ligase family protein [Halopenitus sp. H-Gu1]|uniref:RNA ligase family protein n=1 Tax=Halopenitus sp. H-Gu1 TaxID=3242697 RepID=UPI00359CE2A3
MKTYPSIPRIEDAPDRLLKEGHLWLLEKVDGGHLRFQLRPSGLIQFGDRNRVYKDPDDIPDQYRHAVHHVREHLDREALRTAIDDIEDVVFFGEATYLQRIDYEWDRMPPFLGFDVWSADADAFRPPDSVEAIFEELGLRPINVFEQEVRARDFDPDPDAIPDSAWYDGPAEGIVLRDKGGRRAKILDPDVEEADGTTPIEGSPREVADRYVTAHRLERIAAGITDRNHPVTVETLSERGLEELVREEYSRLAQGPDPVEMDDLRSAVTELTGRFLDDRGER